ncbi:hypothetical protein Mgra_00007659 [Meloidogyne graminicola]|uniref:Uncharacterized protein n=1 Tax=Meloidogyne graminicola TaxID=189291 RepID=A0A8S9ZI29_9BILA|nr:hypothetical protein Mgra_00007659 [Meloidogyne graminicola]
MNNSINNLTASDKRRKSLFGFSIKLKPFSTTNELLHMKRHNSVSIERDRNNETLETEENVIESERNEQTFRLSSGNSSPLYFNRKEIGETEENERDKQRNNNNSNYTQSFRSAFGNNSHHSKGSVQSLVIRRQRAAASTKRFSPSSSFSPLARRPSVPISSPLSIVGRLRKSLSTTSLDEEEDSAFCSAESSSSPACSIISSSIESSPIKNKENIAIAFQWKWTEQQKINIKAELEEYCKDSFGHKLAKNPKLAFNYQAKRQLNKQIEKDVNNNDVVLCAEGKVQFHLLSLIAPPHKRIVNIGSPSIISTNNTNQHWFHLSPSLRPYSMSNLELNV